MSALWSPQSVTQLSVDRTAYNGYQNGIKHNASINVNNNQAVGERERAKEKSQRVGDECKLGETVGRVSVRVRG